MQEQPKPEAKPAEGKPSAEEAKPEDMDAEPSSGPAAADAPADDAMEQ